VSILTSPAVVVAAGAVCWREVGGKLKVLLVHRDTRADVSLPKGKLDPGETPPETAVREVEEETGLRIALGVPLGTIEYTMGGGREKIVYYWASEVSDSSLEASTFSPNDEIAKLEWLSLDKARKAVSYDRDRDILDRFSTVVEAGNHKTFAIIALRHAKAVPPASWDGPDSTRPLLHRGLEQSKSTAAAVAAYRPQRLVCSPAVRCMMTMEPIAELTELTVNTSKGISQDSYEIGASTVAKVVKRQIEKGRTAVLCSHGPVLPDIITETAKATHTDIDASLRRAGMLSTAEFSVLHISRDHPDGGIVAVETHGPAPKD
jgi:8-oxo-(d)GTP phosphatase